MAQYFSQQTAGYAALPIIKPTDPAYGGRAFRFRAVINLASIDSSVYGTKLTTGLTTADNLVLGRLPAGYVPDFGMLTSSVTLATSVIAIGTSPTHASNGQYRAAAVSTAVDTPAVFGVTATMAAASALTTDTLVYLTVATANLPAAGTLVIDIRCNKP